MAKDNKSSGTPIVPPAKAEAPKVEAPKPGGKTKQKIHWAADEAEAVKLASAAEAGCRKAFRVEHNGETKFLVSAGLDQAHRVAVQKLHPSLTVTEVGKPPKAPKVLNLGVVMEAVNAMPAAEREEVMAQIAKLQAQQSAAK